MGKHGQSTFKVFSSIDNWSLGDRIVGDGDVCARGIGVEANEEEESSGTEDSKLPVHGVFAAIFVPLHVHYRVLFLEFFGSKSVVNHSAKSNRITEYL